MMDLSSQAIGIIAGVLVFLCTVVVTFTLLVFGGSFKRMREQAETYNAAGPGALKQALKPRPELYDELLHASRTLPKIPASPALDGGTDGAILDSTAAGELRGKHVTLRVLRCSEDAPNLFRACNGSTTLGHAYDPDLALWCFSPHGPFETMEEMTSSPLMQPLKDGLRFTVFDRETGSVIGMAAILANEPSCLRVEIGDVWLNPTYQETCALQDVYYLLLGHLFGLGYRRVETRVDAGNSDARKDLPLAGFHLEGVLRKHMIVKGCNRDTALFSMLNGEWRDGAKQALEKKLTKDGGATKRVVSNRAKPSSKAPEVEETAVVTTGTAQPVTGIENGESRSSPNPPMASGTADIAKESSKDKDA